MSQYAPRDKPGPDTTDVALRITLNNIVLTDFLVMTGAVQRARGIFKEAGDRV